jgi:hypothetical protein
MFSFIEKEKLDHLLISGYTEDGFNCLKAYLNEKASGFQQFNIQPETI